MLWPEILLLSNLIQIAARMAHARAVAGNLFSQPIWASCGPLWCGPCCGRGAAARTWADKDRHTNEMCKQRREHKVKCAVKKCSTARADNARQPFRHFEVYFAGEVRQKHQKGLTWREGGWLCSRDLFLAAGQVHRRRNNLANMCPSGRSWSWSCSCRRTTKETARCGRERRPKVATN